MDIFNFGLLSTSGVLHHREHSLSQSYVYMGLICWYQKSIFWYQKNTKYLFISKNHFLISKIQICDIRKSINFLYQKIIPNFLFSDIKNSISWNQKWFFDNTIWILDFRKWIFFYIKSRIILLISRIIFWYQELIFWYQELELLILIILFLISEIPQKYSNGASYLRPYV